MELVKGLSYDLRMELHKITGGHTPNGGEMKSVTSRLGVFFVDNVNGPHDSSICPLSPGGWL